MPIFLTILKKIAPYVKYVVFVAVVALLTTLFIRKNNQVDELNKAMDLYKRQMAGQLTEKEQQFQAANQALGIAQSKLMEQKDLVEAYKKANIATSAEFEAFKKKYNVELESFHRTIARLEQQIKDGKTVVKGDEPRLPTDPKPDQQFDHPIDPQTTKLSYQWNSGDGRFELFDPDVFVSNNETFKLQQHFRITGEVYREKAGFLKTEKLSVEEVVPDGTNSDGSPKYKVINSAKVVQSNFNYTERAPDAWIPKKGVFRLTGIVSINGALNNGLNPRALLGTGLEFLSWKGLALGVQLYLDMNQWRESGFGAHLAYYPIINGTQLNVGIGLGIGTQFKEPFQSYIGTLGLNFRLW